MLTIQLYYNTVLDVLSACGNLNQNPKAVFWQCAYLLEQHYNFQRVAGVLGDPYQNLPQMDFLVWAIHPPDVALPFKLHRSPPCSPCTSSAPVPFSVPFPSVLTVLIDFPTMDITKNFTAADAQRLPEDFFCEDVSYRYKFKTS